jgi:hypothetical protein
VAVWLDEAGFAVDGGVDVVHRVWQDGCVWLWQCGRVAVWQWLWQGGSDTPGSGCVAVAVAGGMSHCRAATAGLTVVFD